MAWMAFMNRLMKTCSILALSNRTRGKSGANCRARDMRERVSS